MPRSEKLVAPSFSCGSCISRLKTILQKRDNWRGRILAGWNQSNYENKTSAEQNADDVPSLPQRRKEPGWEFFETGFAP
jgi:hypothetical protein